MRGMSLKIMNILITGGAGFIGNAIVKKLYKNPENRIFVIDALTEQIHGKNPDESYLYQEIADKCQFVRADIRDYEAVADVVQQSDYIIHLAAETGTGQSMYQINQYNEVNVMGTSNLFQAISSTGARIKKIILASSRSVYGEGKYGCKKHGVMYPNGRRIEDMKRGDFAMRCPLCNEELELLPTDEESKISPNSLYAFTKYAQEQMVETMCKAMGIEYTIFRLQNVYGVGQSLKNPYTGILSIFSTLLLDNKQINVFEDGKESRDFINVKDVADAVVKALDTKKSNDEIINIGSGIGTSIIDIAEMLKRLYDSNSIIKVTRDFRVGDIAHNIADISKAQEVLDFKAMIKLEDGLRDFAEWVRGQETDNSGYNQSLEEMERVGMLVRGL